MARKYILLKSSKKINHQMIIFIYNLDNPKPKKQKKKKKLHSSYNLFSWKKCNILKELLYDF